MRNATCAVWLRSRSLNQPRKRRPTAKQTDRSASSISLSRKQNCTLISSGARSRPTKLKETPLSLPPGRPFNRASQTHTQSIFQTVWPTPTPRPLHSRILTSMLRMKPCCNKLPWLMRKTLCRKPRTVPVPSTSKERATIWLLSTTGR